MAKTEHVAKLKEGVQLWNTWREANPDEWIDLSEANLVETNLEFINLQRANLLEVNLQGSNLLKANLQWASLQDAGQGSSRK